MEKKHLIVKSTVKVYMELKKVSKTQCSVTDLYLKDVNDIANETELNYTNVQSDWNNKVKEELISLLIKTMSTSPKQG